VLSLPITRNWQQIKAKCQRIDAASVAAL
jgi:hypothetical protein